MIAAILLAAAGPQPSEAFVDACYERAQNQAETNFCVAGEQESKKHEIMDAEETACMDADQSQQGMNMCAGEAYQRADKALNAQWQKVIARYGDDAKAKALLLEGQRAWLTYRDAQCQMAAYDSIGGSIWPLINSGCLAELTRRRTRELAEVFQGEGD
jgi:uncharacterized protein YecT (DUF1311 family)